MVKSKPTAWVGWVYFASAMMLLVGGMQIIAGLVALFKEDFYLVTQNALLVSNYSAWGWAHIILGTLVFCAGIALMAGRTWAVIVGVVLAILNALANLAFISAYPIWAIVAISIDVAVIYALTMHGSEVR